MIKSNIATTLVAFAIAAPLLHGAENEPKSRIPTFAIDPHGANGKFVASGVITHSDAPEHGVKEIQDLKEITGLPVAEGFATLSDDSLVVAQSTTKRSDAPGHGVKEIQDLKEITGLPVAAGFATLSDDSLVVAQSTAKHSDAPEHGVKEVQDLKEITGLPVTGGLATLSDDSLVEAQNTTKHSDAPGHGVKEIQDLKEITGLPVTEGFATLSDDSLVVAQGRVKVGEAAEAIQEIQLPEEIELDQVVEGKKLRWTPGQPPHVLKLPFDSGNTEKVESKTLLWRPEDGNDFIYTLDKSPQLNTGPWLGVHVSEVSELVASQLGLASGMGLSVEHIVLNSPADKAGLKQYDILTKLDDQTLITPKQLVVLLRTKKSGESVKLTYIRGGEEQSAKAVITNRSGKNEFSYHFDAASDDEDVVFELGAEPVVIDRKMAEKMNAIEKSILASAMAKGKNSELKKGMHTSLFFVENSNLVLSDDTGTYNLRNIDGKKRLVVLNPEGDTIYKGDLETEKSIEALPEGIREKVKEMTGQNKTEHLMRFYKKVDDKDHDNTTPHEVLVEEKIIINPDIQH